MNLHGIVANAISTVNPFVDATIQTSTGYTTNADGSRTPTYTTITAKAQVQSLSSKELEQVGGLNQNNNLIAIYFYGSYDAVVRKDGKGGDIVTLSGNYNTGNWLVIQNLEQWPDWCKLVLALQNNGY